MCVLIVVKDKFPTKEFLQLCETKNKDGAGVAWIEGKKVAWKKGLTADEVYKMKDKLPNPCIIHFRAAWGTNLKGDDHCHPFPVTADVSTDLEGKAEKVLAHNGAWTDFKKAVMNIVSHKAPMYQGEATDTRAIAWLNFHMGDNLLYYLNHKIATLTSKGFVVYGKGWTIKDGLYVSNDPTTTYSKPKQDDKWTE